MSDIKIYNNISLRPYNSFGIDASAKRFATFSATSELEELLNIRNTEQLLVLGGGSNILLTKNFDGLVLKNEIKEIEMIGEDADYFYVRAGAGENWHGFVMYCIDHNLAGVENLSLIPGNVGASPMQNIGAYGVEIKDVFHELEAYHLTEKEVVRFSKEDCRFGYRESIFKQQLKGQFAILSVSFRFSKLPHLNTSYGAIEEELVKMKVSNPDIKSISQAVIHIRSSKLPDPRVIGNAGSFFKNPEIPGNQFLSLKETFPGMIGYSLENGKVKLAAGWLIEQCGWKGFRRGDAGCHEKQALVLVNYANASGKEIFALSDEIMQSVQAKFGVLLEREVNIV